LVIPRSGEPQSGYFTGPIPRGKTKARIEFGSKLGVRLDKGFARINTFSWDAYHEGGDLIKKD